MRFQIPDTLKTLLGNAVLVIAFIVISAIAEQIEPLVRISRQLDEDPQPWISIAIGMAAVGWASFMISIFVLLFGKENVKRKTKRGEVKLEASNTYAMGDIKAAFRTGQWVHDAEWRKLALVICSALLMALGLFSIFIVIGPPGVKVGIIIVLVYAAVMISRGIARAE